MKNALLIQALCLFLGLVVSCTPQDKNNSTKSLQNEVVWAEKNSEPSQEADKVLIPLTGWSSIRPIISDNILYITAPGIVDDEDGVYRKNRYQIVKQKKDGAWESILDIAFDVHTYDPIPGDTLKIVKSSIYKGQVYLLGDHSTTGAQVYKLGPNNTLIKFGPELPFHAWEWTEMEFSNNGDLWIGQSSSNKYDLIGVKQNQLIDASLEDLTYPPSSHSYTKMLHLDGNDLYIVGNCGLVACVFKKSSENRWEKVFETEVAPSGFMMKSLSFSVLAGYVGMNVHYKDSKEERSLSRFYSKTVDGSWIKDSEEDESDGNLNVQNIISAGGPGNYGVVDTMLRGVQINMFFWWKGTQAMTPNRFAMGKIAGSGPDSSIVFNNHLFLFHSDAKGFGLYMSDFGTIR
jgi:hypothetical protein